MFARPSPPSTRGFAARPLDRPGGEGLVARLGLHLLNMFTAGCLHHRTAACALCGLISLWSA